MNIAYKDGCSEYNDLKVSYRVYQSDAYVTRTYSSKPRLFLKYHFSEQQNCFVNNTIRDMLHKLIHLFSSGQLLLSENFRNVEPSEHIA